MKRVLKKIFCSLALLTTGTAVAGTAPDTMAERAKPCLVCHTPEGKSGKDAYYPRIAGKPAGYLFNQMVNFRDGRRQQRAMSLLLQNLSDDYLRDLAAFFATQPPVYPAAVGKAIEAPALIAKGNPARGIPACTACHGEPLMGVVPHIPGTAGLPRDYIVAQFGAWRVGTRKAASPDCMAAIALKLTDSEIGQIADWLSTVAVPANAHPAAQLSAALPEACGSVTAIVPAASGAKK